MNDWTRYDRGAALDSLAGEAAADGTRELLLAVDGVHCGACVRGVQDALAGAATDVHVDVASRTASLRFDPRAVRLSALMQRLARAGFAPRLLARDEADDAQLRDARRSALARIGVAVICAMQVMMLAWPEYFDGGEIDPGILQLMRWSQWIVATPAVFYSGWPFIDSAWRALSARRLNMDVPVAASILIAYVASAWRTLQGDGGLYFDAATMFVMLLGIGRYLEGRTRGVAGERLRLLAQRQVLDATRIEEGGRALRVPLSQLAVGDRLRVAPGEALPADGELLDAVADLDESLLTGEARPVHHRQGDALLGGSLNVGVQALELRVTAAGAATRLSAITRLLHRARQDKPRVQLVADRIAGHFVLAVLLLAVAGAAWWWPQDPEIALHVLLSVLVASCPCALSLSIPSVFAAASARLAGDGVLLARPSALARLPRVTHVLFDKTGTLTETQLALAVTQPLAGIAAARCRAIAAALERDLRHPIAQALSAGDDAGLVADDVGLLEGGGVRGRVDGADYRLVAAQAVVDGGDAARVFAACRAQAASDCTWVALADGDARPLALFGLRARLRADAASTVAAMRAQGVEVWLLTGDREDAARPLAAAAGIDVVLAQQTPELKLAGLQQLQAQGAVVMAVGDGINDAPLLAAADVAVAMPAGAALAQARADAILTGEALAGLLRLRSVAASASRRIRENLGWSLGYNLLMLPIAFSGSLTPWLAALGMSVSSLIVGVNALRLRSADARDAAPPRADAIGAVAATAR